MGTYYRPKKKKSIFVWSGIHDTLEPEPSTVKTKVDKPCLRFQSTTLLNTKKTSYFNLTLTYGIIR